MSKKASSSSRTRSSLKPPNTEEAESGGEKETDSLKRKTTRSKSRSESQSKISKTMGKKAENDQEDEQPINTGHASRSNLRRSKSLMNTGSDGQSKSNFKIY